MTPAELRAAGEALYGERWQTPLARALGVTARLVRYWLAEDRPIPPRRAGQIADLLRERRRHIAAVLRAS